jgi:hypothetical protein
MKRAINIISYQYTINLYNVILMTIFVKVKNLMLIYYELLKRI